MFVKLKDLDKFRVTKYNDFSFKKWDEAEKKMLTSRSWQEGYQKRHSLAIDNGTAEDSTLEVSQAQLAQMLEGVMENGMANILGREFSVKTNGKTGMEIRYFINPIWPKGNNTQETPQNASQGQTEANNSLPQPGSTQTASPGDPSYIDVSQINF